MEKLNGKNLSIQDLIALINSNEAYYFDIPDEYRLNIEIVRVQRHLGIRQSTKRGYDIIKMMFFVEELVVCKKWDNELTNQIIYNYFDNFESYYNFLDGDIYTNACYYEYNFSTDIITRFSIDMKKINSRSLISQTIDDFSLDFSADEISQFRLKEKEKSHLQKTLRKLNDCTKYTDFYKILNLSLSKEIFNFLFYNYVHENIDTRLDFILKYINQKYDLGLERSMCLLSNAQSILEMFMPVGCSQQTANRYIKRLLYFIEKLQDNQIIFSYDSYFDNETHYYVYRCIGKLATDLPAIVTTYKYFNTFDELAQFLNNDLSYCNLSNAIIPNLDLSKYKVNEQTKLPVQYQNNPTYEIKKYYDRKENLFVVKQKWLNENGQIIKNYCHSFRYFFDFAYFLKNDLSNADLVFCDGIDNILDLSCLNFENVNLRSRILDKLGIPYKIFSTNTIQLFKPILKNEKETIPVLCDTRLPLSFDEELKCQKIYYISDIHLWHRLKKANCKNLCDAIYIIQKIIDDLLQYIHGYYSNNLILIGGDTASEFNLFELFVKRLRQTLEEKKCNATKVVFILGNHELWDFAGEKFSDIVEKYNIVLNKYGMYLLQNNIIATFDDDVIEQISTSEIINYSKQEIEQRLLRVRLILFGGL